MALPFGYVLNIYSNLLRHNNIILIAHEGGEEG